MSDQSAAYRPQGEGPHPTLGGNLFDPKVEADGMKSGRGVGAMSESTIKDEAQEHIDQHGYGTKGSEPAFGPGSGMTSGSGTTSGTGIGSGQSRGVGKSNRGHKPTRAAHSVADTRDNPM